MKASLKLSWPTMMNDLSEYEVEFNGENHRNGGG